MGPALWNIALLFHRARTMVRMRVRPRLALWNRVFHALSNKVFTGHGAGDPQGEHPDPPSHHPLGEGVPRLP